MSRATELQINGLPAGVAVYLATHRLADDAARAVVDFVRGVRADLPDGLSALRVSMEAWRGEYLGGLADKREVCYFEPPKPEITRLRAVCGLEGLESVSARAFLEAYTRAAEGKAVR